jgi:hypothetical protein
MTGSAQRASQPSLVCCICNSALPLETGNTDEHGRAVHEECYVRKTISRFRIGSAGRLCESWLGSICVAYDAE